MRTDTARTLLALAVAAMVAGCGSTSPTASMLIPTPTELATASDVASPSASTRTESPSITPSAGATTLPSKSADQATADWPVYHLDSTHSGNAVHFPALSGALTKAWSVKLDGAVYAEPLVVNGTVIAATEGDSVYALEPTTGGTIWSNQLGTPVPLSTLPCGNVDPLGITGTPAYDAATKTIFAVAEVKGPAHILFALDPATGATRWSRNVDLPGHTPRNHQQRPALAVGNGYVYIGFGGLAGDCAQYEGEVVGVSTSGSGATISYTVPVKREGAVWATGGPVLDAAGNLYISIGNGSSTTTYDGSDSVVELSPTLKMISRFAPTRWAKDNASDADLGSLAPVLVPGGFVFIAGKAGIGYVLRQGNLGGIGHQVSSAGVCAAFGGAAQDGATIFVPCVSQLREVAVGADGSLHLGWKSTAAGGPPVIGGGAVWTASGSHLYALDVKTGSTRASISVGTLPHFASPTLWNGLVFIGTMSGVFAVKA
jgi:outer membrane protein assembly factor BamB